MSQRQPRALLGLLCLGGVAAAACGDERRPVRQGQPAQQAASEAAGAHELRPVQLVQVPAELAQKPRLRAEDQGPPGLQAVPDGELGEWPVDGGYWLKDPVVLETRPNGAGGAGAAQPLRARAALASYRRGLSLALEVHDPEHKPASAPGTIRQADHIELELMPASSHSARQVPESFGLKVLLGTQRQLVVVQRPQESWREGAISSAGVAQDGGYRLEARIPLIALTPLPAPVVDRLHYRLTIFDAQAQGQARAALRFSGTLELSVPMEVPAAVRERASLRTCLAANPEAIYGYEQGWRCSIPYRRPVVRLDDAVVESDWQLGHAVIPTPPVLKWIRQRVLLVNIGGVSRGVAALLDGKDTILSLARLGVMGARVPGNALARDAEAEPLELPDGSWAIALTHALPLAAETVGGRCAGGYQVWATILAIRGSQTTTPDAPPPERKEPLALEEVFQTLLEDCARSVSNDWTLSDDRQTIKVQSSVTPSRPPEIHDYRDGRFRRREARDQPRAASDRDQPRAASDRDQPRGSQ